MQINCCNLLLCLISGAGSTKSSIYKFQKGEKPVIEVGEGNLKLTISAPSGKIINYVNHRNLVGNT